MLVLISFSRLHSCIENFTRGMFRGGDMCLGSLFWIKKLLFRMMFSYSVCCLLVKNVNIIFVLCCMTLGVLLGNNSLFGSFFY